MAERSRWSTGASGMGKIEARMKGSTCEVEVEAGLEVPVITEFGLAQISKNAGLEDV